MSRKKENLGGLTAAGARQSFELPFEGIADTKGSPKRSDGKGAGEDTNERQQKTLAKTLQGKGKEIQRGLVRFLANGLELRRHPRFRRGKGIRAL